MADNRLVLGHANPEIPQSMQPTREQIQRNHSLQARAPVNLQDKKRKSQQKIGPKKLFSDNDDISKNMGKKAPDSDFDSVKLSEK